MTLFIRVSLPLSNQVAVQHETSTLFIHTLTQMWENCGACKRKQKYRNLFHFKSIESRGCKQIKPIHFFQRGSQDACYYCRCWCGLFDSISLLFLRLLTIILFKSQTTYTAKQDAIKVLSANLPRKKRVGERCGSIGTNQM